VASAAPGSAEAELSAAIERGIGDALGKTQAMLAAFSPAIVAPENLEGLVRVELERWKSLGLVKDARLVADAVPPSAEIAQAAYWIAKEAIANAAKHAGGASVEVRMLGDGYSFRLCVVDDGPGFSDNLAFPNVGLGLVVMRSRAREVGGVLSVRTGQGTEISFTIHQ
jgi:signal transduction histidine kinase